MAKKTTKKTGAPDEGLKVPARGVRVRMYRQGFGDCFLLSFGRGDGKPLHMLIDCGLLMGAPSPDQMRAAVDQVFAETGGELDVVVCSHEHVDHVSGFLHARETWSRMKIGELWFAWTEDPSNKAAKRLREQRERRKQGLSAAVKRLNAAGARPGTLGAAAQVESALTFFGASGSTSDTGAALEFVRELAGKRPRYLKPGALESVGELPGVRFFVLGPPLDEKLLKQDKASTKEPEVYHAVGEMTADAAFFAAAAGGGDLESGAEHHTRTERSSPFEAIFRIPARDVEKPAADAPEQVRHLHSLYHAKTRRESDATYVGSRELRRSEWNAEQDWRRIDEDWLGVAGALAMKLDEDTNNTSLVLAIELVKSQQVLLFPGDAQVGNWLSWDRCDFKVREADGSDHRVNAADLLSRTVLYKVGHHGSHNATMKEKGLERMTSKKLVAMIPTDESTAKKQGRKDQNGKPRGWAIPFKPLMKALKEKTGGRILRADGPAPSGKGRKPSEWKWFERTSKVTPLFMDLVVEDA
jgi:hypothetical protein